VTDATRQEILQALQENGQQPHGTIRCSTAEDLAAAAERLDDDSLLVTALCELMNAYEYGAERAKQPVTLARLLQIYDQNRAAFSDWEVRRLHWFFKWITFTLLELPDVPIQALHDWIGQMSERYAAAGLKAQAVHAMRYHVAEHTGVDADIFYDLWATRPRDSMSDCEACEARHRAEYYALRGNDAHALRDWQPVLDGKLTCAEEPALTLASALLPMVRAGRLEDAVSAHRTGYRLVRGHVNLAVPAGEHIEFCALTGNEARGAELLAHSRGYFGEPRTLTDLKFLGGVQVLLARLVADGHGDVPVAGPPGASYTAASLLDHVATDAAALAARFDARNGTTWIGDRYRARTGREPLADQPLALGMRGAAAVPPAQPAARSAPPAAVAEPVPETPAELLARARELWKLGRPEADRLWARVAELVPEPGAPGEPAVTVAGVLVDDVLRGELATLRGHRRARSGRWQEAREEYRRARDAFEAAAEPGRASTAEARSLWAALPPGTDIAQAEASASWAGLEGALARARALLDARRMEPDHYLAVLHCRALALLQHPPVPDGAGATADASDDRLAAECELLRSEALRLGVPHRAAIGLVLRAQNAARRGQDEVAATALREAVSHLRESERPWMLPAVCCYLADALNRTGHPDDARALIHEALTLAADWPDEEFNQGGALMVLAEACRVAGDPQAAAAHFADAAGRFDRQREPQRACLARAALGHALLAAGRPGDAVAVLESLRDDGEDSLDSRNRAQARLNLARGLRQTGEHRAAAQELVWLAEFVSDWPDEPATFAMVVGELAAALAAAGLWDQVDGAIQRAMAAHASNPNPAAICHMLRMVADSSIQRGRDAIDATLGYLGQADEVNERATEIPGRYAKWPETAQNAELRARALAEAGQNQDALAAAEVSLRAYEAGGERTLAKQAELVRIAAILEGLRLGDRSSAVVRLEPIIGRCQTAGLADQAAQLSDLRTRLTA
jgi:hypothetical protein